jgi:hypothetical protein
MSAKKCHRSLGSSIGSYATIDEIPGDYCSIQNVWELVELREQPYNTPATKGHTLYWVRLDYNNLIEVREYF